MGDHRAARELEQRVLQARSVSTSRSLVGSSSSSRLPPCLRVSARLSRLRSPPDSTPAGFCWSGPLNPNAADVGAGGHLDLADLDEVEPVGDDLPHVLLRVDAAAVLVDVGDLTVSPTLIVPPSGFSTPTIILNSVVLPTPFGPMTPTMPLRGRVNDRLVDQHAVAEALGQLARPRRRSSPAAVPAGSGSPRSPACGCGRPRPPSPRSAASRALDLAWRALALERTQSSSSSRRLRSLASLWPSTSSRSAFFSR